MADCLQFHDIFESPQGKPKDVALQIKQRNTRNELIYKAVRHVLKHDFDFKDRIPVEPTSFPTAQLADSDRAQFIAILGIIQADNWEDPRNGKERPSVDDVFVDGTEAGSTATWDWKGDPGKPITEFVIDRRFVDAVVEAVKEYTASSKLFNNVYKLMREEASEGLDGKRASASVS